jgi:hypothetical protein
LALAERFAVLRWAMNRSPVRGPCGGLFWCNSCLAELF